MDMLKQLFEENQRHSDTHSQALKSVQDGQAPPVVSISCSDSRVLQDGMWNNDVPGRIFTCGNIGNRVTQRTEEGLHVSGDVLYPLLNTNTKIALVVGHTGCGAVTAAYETVTGTGNGVPPSITECLSQIKPAVESGLDALSDTLDGPEIVHHLVEYNVDHQVHHLLESEEVPDIDVVGSVYDLHGAYHDGKAGRVYVTNINGERDPEQLSASRPDLEPYINRLTIRT